MQACGLRKACRQYAKILAASDPPSLLRLQCLPFPRLSARGVSIKTLNAPFTGPLVVRPLQAFVVSQSQSILESLLLASAHRPRACNQTDRAVLPNGQIGADPISQSASARLVE